MKYYSQKLFIVVLFTLLACNSERTDRQGKTEEPTEVHSTKDSVPNQSPSSIPSLEYTDILGSWAEAGLIYAEFRIENDSISFMENIGQSYSVKLVDMNIVFYDNDFRDTIWVQAWKTDSLRLSTIKGHKGYWYERLQN